MDCQYQLKLTNTLSWRPYFARAINNYKSVIPEELGLKTGEMIEVLHMSEDGWCQGLSRTGQKGRFPGSYVRPVLDRRMIQE
jgi:hypothetical protein